ncbi:hypothetical protein BDQ94DRAFT_165645 [Aspergillus welwitschiae]|uniref:Uncharacterized protein n=1 Tax=Aspergillus welwitschiae TaxID=1341132 RepID=A0A3F3QHU6_9EURO|nr:hypothetical protein BDQ94DRAFT_165645 [Aspergillus welwitschiae]RDH38509.1 hypothetical protein BDQ94DRAFT_165645 [Aspergillus welwitschiae]
MAKDAVLSRIAKGLGAYMEGFDGSTSSEIIVLTIRLKYEWQAAESLDKFPHTYVSCITEPSSLSFVRTRSLHRPCITIVVNLNNR